MIFKGCSSVQSIGDTWNHITNVQCKLGVSALFNTLFVLPSAIAVDYLYFNVTETAGWVLFPMVCWLTIACVLVWSIWDLNDRQELLPTST
jgi:tryptophan-rich sensory protein